MGILFKELTMCSKINSECASSFQKLHLLLVMGLIRKLNTIKKIVKHIWKLKISLGNIQRGFTNSTREGRDLCRQGPIARL